MFEALIVSGLAALVFVATNLDSLFVLLAFLAQPGARTGAVRLAYLGAIATVLMLSLAAASGADVIPARLSFQLGFVPIAFGLWGIVQLWRSKGEEAPVSLSPNTGPLWLMALTALHSADSLAVFTALLAETRESLHVFVVATGLGCGLLWIWLAGRLLDHEQLGSGLRRLAPYLLPPLLILVGIYIIADTPTDVQM